MCTNGMVVLQIGSMMNILNTHLINTYITNTDVDNFHMYACVGVFRRKM